MPLHDYARGGRGGGGVWSRPSPPSQHVPVGGKGGARGVLHGDHHRGQAVYGKAMRVVFAETSSFPQPPEPFPRASSVAGFVLPCYPGMNRVVNFCSSSIVNPAGASKLPHQP